MTAFFLLGAGVLALQYLNTQVQAGENLLFSVDGIKVLSIKSGYVNFEIPIEVTNPNRVPISVSEVFLVLIADNSQSLGSAAFPGQINILPQNASIIRVPVRVKLGRVLAYALNFLVTKQLGNLSVKGSFRAMGQTVPVEVDNLMALMA